MKRLDPDLRRRSDNPFIGPFFTLSLRSLLTERTMAPKHKEEEDAEALLVDHKKRSIPDSEGDEEIVHIFNPK